MNLKKCVLICFLALILISPNVYGKRNLSQNSSDSHKSAIAVNSSGVILAVWLEGPVGYESGDLYYSVYKDGEWSVPKDARLTLYTAWSPFLAVDSSGKFHMAWADGWSSAAREIFHATYDPDSGWSRRTEIYNSPYNSAWERIAIDKNVASGSDKDADSIIDMVYIAWFHQHTEPWLSDIVMQSKQVGKDYSWPAAYERISWHPDDEGIHPALMVKNGVVHVAYMEGTGPEAPWRLRYKEGKSGSFREGQEPETLNDNGYYPSLDVDNNGDVVVVFSNRTGNFYAKTKEKGTWKSTLNLSTGYAPLQFGEVRHNNNVLVAVWVQGFQGGVGVAYAKKESRKAWEKPVKLSDPGEAFFPNLWIDDDGYVHIVYDDTGGVGGGRDIYYEKIKVYEPTDKPHIKLNKSSLSFTTLKGEDPNSKDFTVKNTGGRSMNYTASVDKEWISVTPTSGSLDAAGKATVEVQIDASSLDVGTHEAVVEIASAQADNSPQQVAVTLTVLTPPTLKVNKSSLSFSNTEEENPDPATFKVKNIGARLLNYTVSVTKKWISVTSTSGILKPNIEKEFQVQIGSSAMDEGSYKATITISSAEAVNSPKKISVTLNVLAPPIYAPLNFSGEVKENKTLFYREYIHRFTWQANSNNRHITKYRLYENDGVNRILLKEFSSSVFTYERRQINKSKDYTYELIAVDQKDRTGTAATLTIQSATR